VVRMKITAKNTHIASPQDWHLCRVCGVDLSHNQPRQITWRRMNGPEMSSGFPTDCVRSQKF
jgi:hypothetical protein